MPQAKSTDSKTKSASSKKAAETESVKRFDGRSVKMPHGLAFLMQQHREVEGWFEEFEKAEDRGRKIELSGKIFAALKVHTQNEEDVLYPPAHDQVDEDGVDEAIVEHDSCKQLIAEMEAMDVDDHMYDAKMKVLSEYIAHHVEEEETELFIKIRESDLDLDAIGKRLESHDKELKAKLKPAPRAGSGDAPEARA